MQILIKVLTILILAAMHGPSTNGYEEAAPLRRALLAMAGHHPLIRFASAALAQHATGWARTATSGPQESHHYRLSIEMEKRSRGHRHSDGAVVIYLNTGYLTLAIQDPVSPFRMCFEVGVPAGSSEESLAPRGPPATRQPRETADR